LLNSYRRLPLICHNPPDSDNYGSFVIRDYKLKSKVHRRTSKGRLRIFAAMSLLAATVLTVTFIDPGAGKHSLMAHAGVEPVSTSPLPLPGAAPGDMNADTPGKHHAEPTLLQDPAPRLDTRTMDGDTKTAYTQLPLDRAKPDPKPSLLVDVDPQPKLDPIPQASSEAPASDASEDAGIAEQGDLGNNLELGLSAVAPETVLPPQWIEHRVARGDSLARIFDLQGLDANLLHGIVNSSKEAKSLARIRPGQTLRFQFDENRELTALELQRNRVDSVRVAISDEEISVEEVSKAVEKRVATAAGLIESSLFADGQKAGLSDGLIMKLAAIFGWDIDFALEIRAGDQFRVIYEEQYLDGEKLRNGPILAAEFTNRGTTHTAVRFEDSNGEIGYFDADGHSKRRAFIRTPIKFARVSSRYDPKRWHPVLKKWRSHKGVDYAAPKGTPIKATGDGRVVFRGTKGGYGRTVIVEHAGKYTTLYAHMSKYSKRAKKGNRVKQGQVIGYVGKSGLATGPHLHYEFRVHGKHRDPLRVKLPKSLSLPKSEIARFRETAAPLLTQLAAIQPDTMVASAGGSEAH